MRPTLLIALLVLLSGCVQQTIERTVTFEVDTRGLENVTSVGVRGNDAPLSWNSDYELTDPDGDGIYRGEVTFNTPYHTTQVKFTRDGGVFELEGQPNRILTLKGQTAFTFTARFNEP